MDDLEPAGPAGQPRERPLEPAMPGQPRERELKERNAARVARPRRPARVLTPCERELEERNAEIDRLRKELGEKNAEIDRLTKQVADLEDRLGVAKWPDLGQAGGPLLPFDPFNP